MSDNLQNIDFKTCTTCKTGTTGIISRRTLSDFTFLMPLRIDSEERAANADTVISFILKYFRTSFIVVEGDSTRHYFPSFKEPQLHYEFFHDENTFFHKTKYIDKLIRLAQTKFIAVWDADIIASTGQLINSIEAVRNNPAVFSLPYDGRVYVCESLLSAFFRRIPETEILNKLASSLPLMYGYHSTGGAFLADKEQYLAAGGENQNFCSWGPEDVERVKRMEILDINVHFSHGPLFHLWHPRGKTSRYIDREIEKQNRREFIITCSRYGQI